MKDKKKPVGHWKNKDNCQSEALLYSSRNEFCKKSKTAYETARINGWLDEICSHMGSKRKTKILWTQEKCQMEAFKYKTRSEFYKKSSKAYGAAQRKGWLVTICSHMASADRKQRNHWSRDSCYQVALNYKSRSQFKNNSGSAYSAAIKNGWVDEICSHMQQLQKSNGYWTIEKCHEEALKFTSTKDFRINSSAAYAAALKKKCINEICSHMAPSSKPKGYWKNKLKCHEEALKYSLRSKFQEKSPGAYQAAKKQGWLDEICCHMIITSSNSQRLIYVVFFSQSNIYYIGLTSDLERRKQEHRYAKNSFGENKCSSVYSHYKTTGEIPVFYPLTEMMPAKLAALEEKKTIEKFKRLGRKLLNKNNGGALGSYHRSKWTKDNCHQEALKYNSRAEFLRQAPSAHFAGKKNHWLDEICGHMHESESRQLSRLNARPFLYWSKENCQEAALRCSSRSEFRKKYSGAVGAATKNGWYDEICSHLAFQQKQVGFWNKEQCRIEALKYKNRRDFRKNSSGAIDAATKNGWLDEICAHMTYLREPQVHNSQRKPNGYWTKGKCHQEALKYIKRSDFSSKSSGAYSAMIKNKWTKDICSHMVTKNKDSDNP